MMQRVGSLVQLGDAAAGNWSDQQLKIVVINVSIKGNSPPLSFF